MKKGAFTMMEMIFVIVILGILAAIAIPKYFTVGQRAHEANLIAFVKTLNRTTGEDMWARSISEGKHGKISELNETEGAIFLEKYITIPNEINKSSIDLTNCGNNSYNVVMTIDSSTAGDEYNITCKDGSDIHAPYFKLIRLRDNKVLVSRE